MVLTQKISLEEAEKLVQQIQNIRSVKDKIEMLKTLFKDDKERDSLKRRLASIDLPEFGRYIVWAFYLLGQVHIVDFLLDTDKKLFSKRVRLIDRLQKLENLYEKQGGCLGYHLEFSKCLNQKKKYNFEKFSSCSFLELSSLSQQEISFHVFLGIQTLLETGLCLLAGGRAERFFDSSSERSMASLKFFKKSLLERVLEDIEGLEILYEKFFHRSLTIPLIIMVSSSISLEDSCFIEIKKKDRYLNGFLKILVQSDFPVISSEGLFLLDNGELITLPGGHGMLWREAYQQGYFQYFKNLGIKHILIRQINNPLAGLDKNLLLLLGISCAENKSFGVISCPKDVRYSEGSWVKVSDKETSAHINVEYVDFPYLDSRLLEKAPANTNILYFNLEKNWETLSQLPVFEPILNMKTFVTKNCAKEKQLVGGRLECLIQDFTKFLKDATDENPSVLILNSSRETVISSIKKPLKESCLETPEKAFFDYTNCSRKLLELCHIILPERRSWKNFLTLGPEFIFEYQPSLGPIYALIQKKIFQGNFFEHSVIELNITDVFFRNISVSGHFIVSSSFSGKCFLKNVKIENQGSFFENPKESWKGELCTTECLKISLDEGSKIYAENVLLQGNLHIDVPKGESWELFINDHHKLDYKVLSESLSASYFY